MEARTYLNFRVTDIIEHIEDYDYYLIKHNLVNCYIISLPEIFSDGSDWKLLVFIDNDSGNVVRSTTYDCSSLFDDNKSGMGLTEAYIKYFYTEYEKILPAVDVLAVVIEGITRVGTEFELHVHICSIDRIGFSHTKEPFYIDWVQD